MRALISLLVVPSMVLAVIGRPISQSQSIKLSADESKQVKQFVRAFTRRIRHSRDLEPFLTEPPASDVIDKILLDKENCLPAVSATLIAQANLRDLRQFWIATTNLAYLSELYVYATMSVKGVRTYELPLEKQYPPSIVRMLKRDPLIVKLLRASDANTSDDFIQEAAQLRELTKALDQAGVLMRRYFRTQPPEQTREYSRNIAYFSRYSNVLTALSCDTEAECPGLPLHTRTVTVKVAVLTLMLGWVNGELKILAIGIIDD